MNLYINTNEIVIIELCTDSDYEYNGKWYTYIKFTEGTSRMLLIPIEYKPIGISTGSYEEASNRKENKKEAERVFKKIVNKLISINTTDVVKWVDIEELINKIIKEGKEE